MLFGGRLLSIFVTIGFLILTSAFAQNTAQTYVKAIYSLPLSLDPIKMNDTASLAVGNLIYDGLLKFSPSLKIEGALAESWSTSEDGKTLTFKLKKNIFFHNSEAVTAYDAEASNDVLDKTEPKAPSSARAISWGRLMKRVFQIDVTTCGKCGGDTKIIAAILEKKIIEKILTHLGIETAPPVLHPARAPPQTSFEFH